MSIITGPVQSISQEWVQVVVKALGNELDLATLNSKHQWRHACLGHSIHIDVVKFNKHFEGVHISSAAGKV